MKRKIHLLFATLMAFAVFSCSGDKGQKSGEIIASSADLDGRTISVVSGSIQDIMVTENYPNSTALRSESESDTFVMVESGKAEALVTSSLSWVMAKDTYPSLVSLKEELVSLPIAFGFRKDKAELMEKFNEFLTDYMANNDLDQVTAEWADSESDRKMPNPDEVSGENGTLHFAVSAMTPPFNFIKNGEIAGLEPEIMAKFAVSLNMKWDFSDVMFSGLINYLQSGKADLCAAILCPTEERQKSIDFSIPWANEATIIIVNKKNAPAELIGEDAEDESSFWQSIADSFEKSLVKENRYKLILNGLKATIIISLLAAFFGTLFGMLLCYSSMKKNKLVAGISNVFIEFMRCMPQVVFLMIMFYVVFGKSSIDGMWVAVIAFSLCFGAYTSVIFRSSVESIDKGQTEAALSMGFSKFKAFVNVILPQTVQRALPVYKGEFIGLVKATSIVGYIAVLDLTKAGDIIRSRTYEAFFSLILVTIVYFLVIWALTAILKYVEKVTQPKRKKFFK